MPQEIVHFFNNMVMDQISVCCDLLLDRIIHACLVLLARSAKRSPYNKFFKYEFEVNSFSRHVDSSDCPHECLCIS